MNFSLGTGASVFNPVAGLIPSDFQKLVKPEPKGLLAVEWHDLVSDTYEDFSTDGLLVDAEDIATGVIANQGISRDATHWIYFYTAEIRKYDLVGNLILTNNTPFVGLPAGMTHVGDGVLYNGFIYVGVTNWNGSVATQFLIVKYDASDLSLVDYADISTHETSAGICLSLDKTEIYGVKYDATGSNIIARFDITDFSHIGNIALSETLNKMQGIDVSPDGFINITTWDNISTITAESTIRTVSSDGTVLPWPIRGFGMGVGEIEGCCVYDGIIYANINGSIPRKFIRYTDNDETFLDTFSGQPEIELIDTLGETGTILVRMTPNLLYDSNNIMNASDGTGDWSAWWGLTGILYFRVDAATRIEIPGNVAKQEYIIAFTWEKNGVNVDIKVGVDGFYVGSLTQPWVQLGVGGLRLHSSKSVIEPNGKTKDRGYCVLNKILNDEELLEVSNDWDDLYKIFGA